MRLVIEVSPLQPSKAPLPMYVTLLGMVIVDRLEQPSKVELSMDAKLFGIIMEIRLLHSQNILNLDNQ